MRALASLLAAALLLAGCTSPAFPQGSRILLEREVRDMGPGAAVEEPFTLRSGEAGFLMVGMRTGGATGVWVMLTGPEGTSYEVQRGDPSEPCAVSAPAPGAWRLEVRTDPFDGSLGSGKFTVRAFPGEPPEIVPCTDQPVPARGRTITPALSSWNVTASRSVQLAFAVDRALDGMRLDLHAAPPAPNGTRPDDGMGLPGEGNASSEAPAEQPPEAPLPAAQPAMLDIRWHPPVDEAPIVGHRVGVRPAFGNWTVDVRWPETVPLPEGNATVAVRLFVA